MEKNRVIKNSLWIIGGKALQAGIAFFIGLLTARYLGPSNYGLINYASSLVVFALPIMQLGLTNTLVYEFVNDPENEGKIMGSSLLMCVISSLFCIVGLFVFVRVANPGDNDTILVCSLYSLLLLFQSFEIMQYWFQFKLQSKYTSIATMVAYITVSLYRVYLLISQKDVVWFALSQPIDHFIIMLLFVFFYHKMSGKKICFSFEIVKKLFSKSKYYIISSLMIVIFAQTDKIMIKHMLCDADVGYYSSAATIAGMTSFVFSAIIDSYRPMILQNRKTNIVQYERDLSQLYSMIIYLSLLQCLVINILAKPIVLCLYGANYYNSISALRIIVWFTTFSYLGGVRSIWILAEGKYKYLWIINSSGALGNVLMNFFLIPKFGIEGAAISSVLTQLFTNVIIGWIIKPIRENNRLMTKGLDIRILQINKLLTIIGRGK